MASVDPDEETCSSDTFFTVVLVLVQHKAAPALTAVASEGVDALVLTAAILLGALVFVWQSEEDDRLA